MVPPDSFSIAAPQSSNAFCSGCDAGTQCDIFRSKVFSCAIAGDTQAANSSVSTADKLPKLGKRSVFLIDVSPSATGFAGPLQILLYDIINSATARPRQPTRWLRFKPKTIQ